MLNVLITEENTLCYHTHLGIGLLALKTRGSLTSQGREWAEPSHPSAGRGAEGVVPAPPRAAIGWARGSGSQPAVTQHVESRGCKTLTPPLLCWPGLPATPPLAEPSGKAESKVGCRAVDRLRGEVGTGGQRAGHGIRGRFSGMSSSPPVHFILKTQTSLYP